MIVTRCIDRWFWRGFWSAERTCLLAGQVLRDSDERAVALLVQNTTMAGMYLHAAEFMKIALDARDRAADVRRLSPDHMAEDALVSIVMAAAAAEAFINELGAYYERTCGPLEPRETASGVALAEVERSRGSTELKYLVASLALSGQTFDRGTSPFQEFSTLITIRNDLMHPKPRDNFVDGEGIVPPKYVRDFMQRGMAYTRQADGTSWLNLLETEHVASWACQAAVGIIVAVIAMTPPDGFIATWGKSFSGHYLRRAHQQT